MAISLSIQFLWDRYHATAWSSAVNDGTPEWPPSPWRILRALVATKHNKFPQTDEATFGDIIAKMSGELPTFYLPESMGFHTRHYMPKPNANKTEKILDAFVVLPRNNGNPAPVIVSWSSIDLTSKEAELLKAITTEITYLGRAESQCTVSVLDADIDHLSSKNGYSICRPRSKSTIFSSDQTTVDILCLSSDLSTDDLLETLELTVKEVRTNRLKPLPPGTELVPYLISTDGNVQIEQINKESLINIFSEINTVVFNIFENTRPSIFAGVIMAEALRKAAMSNYGRLYDGAVSESLSGKNSEGQPLSGLHLHSHYLALKSPSSQVSLLDKLIVWCPTGFKADEIQALSNIRELGGANFTAARDFRPCRLGFEGLGNIDEIAPWIVSANGAKTWQSLTPFCSSRPAEWRRPTIGEIKRSVKKECAYRGLPEPVTVEQFAGNRNWNSYRTHRQTGADRGLSNARPAYGLQIEFPEPVHGPISLGALSHFGLGLFEPKKN